MLAVARVTSIIIMKIKDLEVRASSRVVSLDKALCSTLSLFTQVYIWSYGYQRRSCPGDTPYNGLYGEAPTERGTFFRPQVYERVGILLVEVYERVCERPKRANR